MSLTREGQMRIEFQGKVTPADVRRAVFMNYSPAYIWINVLLSGTAVLALAYMILQGNLSGTPSFLWLAILAVLTMPLWQPFIFSQSANRKGSLYHDPLRGEIDEHGVSIHTGEIQTASPWESYTLYRTGRDIALLYKGKYCVNILTPRLFRSPQDWDQALALIRTKVPSPRSGARLFQKK